MSRSPSERLIYLKRDDPDHFLVLNYYMSARDLVRKCGFRSLGSDLLYREYPYQTKRVVITYVRFEETSNPKDKSRTRYKISDVAFLDA